MQNQLNSWGQKSAYASLCQWISISRSPAQIDPRKRRCDLPPITSGSNRLKHGCAKLVSSAMAAGDVQRIWFEEMIATLRSKWQRGLAFDELIRLRDELDEMLQQIRAERQIRSPVVKCPICGHIGEGAAPRVSVRAMILSSDSI